jgi:uncharacterized protein (TIGR02246 family)
LTKGVPSAPGDTAVTGDSEKSRRGSEATDHPKNPEDTMKMRLLLAFPALVIGFAVPALAQEKDTVDPQVRQQIEAVLKKHEEAYNEYDAAAFAAGFTEYAVELSQGGMARGRQEIEERYAADLASHPTKQSFKLVQVCAVGDAICAISEFFHYNTQTKGHYAAIYVREGDTWKIRMAYAQ